MTEFLNNDRRGITTPTPEQHIKTFDFEVIPGAPATQINQAPYDPAGANRSVEEHKPNQTVRTTKQDLIASVACAIFGATTVAYTNPQLQTNQPEYWVLTALVGVAAFFIQRVYDGQN